MGTTGESNYRNEKISNLKREIFSRFCNASLVIDFQMSRHFGVQSIFTPVFPALRVVYKVSFPAMTGWFDYPCLVGQTQRKNSKLTSFESHTSNPCKYITFLKELPRRFRISIWIPFRRPFSSNFISPVKPSRFTCGEQSFILGLKPHFHKGFTKLAFTIV